MGYEEERPSIDPIEFENVFKQYLENKNYIINKLNKNELRVIHHVERYCFISTLINEEKYNGNKLNIIDLGCGEGIGLKYLRDRLPKYFLDEINGLDVIDKVAIPFTTILPNSKFHHSGIEEFDKDGFDIVLCLEVLGDESISSPENLLRKLDTISNNNALIFVSIPNYGDAASHKYFKTTFTPETFKNIIENNFKNLEIEFYGQQYPTKSPTPIYFYDLMKNRENVDFMLCKIKKKKI